MKRTIIYTITGILLLSACDTNHKSDAYGNFEAIETIVSSEASGKILSLDVKEGQAIKKGEIVAYVDSAQLYYQEKQLEAKKEAVSSKIQNILAQIEVQQEQKQILLTEKKRLEKLFKDGAATQQQLDDINGKIKVIEKQIRSIKTQNSQVLNEIEALKWQIRQINDKISKCKIKNPVKGTVLEKYIQEHELVTPGKSLYKIADLDALDLRIYLSGAQLPHIKLGQEVQVLIDKNEKENQELTGTISWISDEAEFTPKVIQTKEERVDQVYAVKVRVKNDGRLKIGMPGEVNFIQKTTKQ